MISVTISDSSNQILTWNQRRVVTVINVAVVGVGTFGITHLQAYSESKNAQVSWICDPDNEARSKCMSGYDVERGTSDYTDALNDDRVDLVDIVAPNYLHKDIAIAAARAGKHVLCEKPLARTVAEAEEMIRVAEESGTQLYAKYHQRFDRAHQTVKNMWESGEMDEYTVTIARRMSNHLGSMLDKTHWRGVPSLTGGGLLFSSGSHTLDVINYIFGPSAAVTAVNRQLVANDPNKADDNATVVIELKSGMHATFVGCWAVRHVAWTTLETYSEESTIRVRTEGKDLVLEREQKDRLEPLWRSQDWFRRSNFDAIHHFVDCVAGVVEPRYDVRDVVESMRTLETAYQSSAEGRRIQIS